MPISVYEDLYARSQGQGEAFWAAAAEDILWFRRWNRVFDDSRPPFYRRAWYRMLAMAGLRRNNVGGFGSTVPIASAG